MPYSGKIKKMAKERGISEMQLISEALALHGTEMKAAMALGLYPNAIRFWRLKNIEKQASKN